MTNSADPNQTAPQEQFDQGLHCLLRQQLSQDLRHHSKLAKVTLQPNCLGDPN